jgi:hypothetical protein
LALGWTKNIVSLSLAMSLQGTKASRSKVGYIQLSEQPHEDRDSSSIRIRASSNNSSSSPLISPDSKRNDDNFDDEDEASLKPSTFQTDGLETFYKPIEGYEGAHRYDPEYTWSSAEEGKVVRKVYLCLPSLDDMSLMNMH